MAGPIRVVGSLNMDLVVQVPHHPGPGETVLGSDYATYPGGKGANQAVAAARAGAQVEMWGAVGSDEFGRLLQENLEHNGVDTRHLRQLEGPSGLALITVDPGGQNRIVVSPGANGRYLPEHLPPFTPAALLLLQLEIPLPTVQAAAEQAFAQGIPILLNSCAHRAIAGIPVAPGSLLGAQRNRSGCPCPIPCGDAGTSPKGGSRTAETRDPNRYPYLGRGRAGLGRWGRKWPLASSSCGSGGYHRCRRWVLWGLSCLFGCRGIPEGSPAFCQCRRCLGCNPCGSPT
jgi:hypothetical protein